MIEKENEDKKKENESLNSFNVLKELQLLIKKESALREICKKKS